MTKVIEARGTNGATVTFDGRTVTIQKGRRTGAPGERSIPLAQISAIGWRRPGWLSPGWISFLTAGVVDRPVGVLAASGKNREPWTVVFGRRHLPGFEQLREAVDEARG